MKNFKAANVITASVIALSLSLSACGKEDFVRDTKAAGAFNTPSDIVFSKDGVKESDKNILSEIYLAANEIELCLSAEKDGDVKKFNDAKPEERIEISDITYTAFCETKEAFEFTEGAYNPAVYPLVDLWGFSPRFLNSYGYPVKKEKYDRDDYKQNLPEQKYIDGFLSLTDFENVSLEEADGKYFVTKPKSEITIDGVTYSMKVDFGGYGKGLAAETGASILKKYGVKKGYVSFGSSSIATVGNYEWEILLTNPDEDKSSGEEWYISTKTSESGVSSGGDYENYYIYDGKRYSHIISPFTGRPTEGGMCAASVIGGSAQEADMLTTALLAMEKEKALSIAKNKLSSFSVSLLERTPSGYTVYTNMEEGKFTLNENLGNFTLKKIGDV